MSMPAEWAGAWSPAVTCPSCNGKGYNEFPQMEAIAVNGEIVPGTGPMCVICEDCERTGVVTAVYLAAIVARADQVFMRAMNEHDPDVAQAFAADAQRLEDQLGLGG